MIMCPLSIRYLTRVFILFILLLPGGCKTYDEYNKPEAGPENHTDTNVSVSDFTLGPGDTVDIHVYGNNELSKKILIGPTGYISYPYIDEIQAKGMSIFQLRDTIKDGLSQYFVNPIVSVNITSNQSQKIFVLGEVNRPGIFQMQGPQSVVEAVSMANGFTHEANMNNILLIRGDIKNPELKLLDMNAFFSKGDISQNISLRPMDIVYIPSTPLVDTERFFRRLYSIILPIVTLEYGIAIEPSAEAALRGESQEVPVNIRLPENLRLPEP